MFYTKKMSFCPASLTLVIINTIAKKADRMIFVKQISYQCNNEKSSVSVMLFSRKYSVFKLNVALVTCYAKKAGMSTCFICWRHTTNTCRKVMMSAHCLVIMNILLAVQVALNDLYSLHTYSTKCGESNYILRQLVGI